MQPKYDHIQKSPLHLILHVIGTFQLVFATSFLALTNLILPVMIFFFSGIIVLIFAFGFQYLHVVDQGDYLTIHFGSLPLPMCNRKLIYKNIIKVEIGRTLFLDGWGIHYSIRGGWVWNIWGRDCVVVYCKKEILRIGTNDAEQLSAFLKTKIECN
ncbi:MAG: hypothetical protein EBT92_09880 [Planctomycetes bacterium]|nr:hypothetical protein [Planctomycetota bacterium]